MVQILFGGFVRHTYSTLGQRGHFLVAFLVVGGVLLLAREVFRLPERDRSLSIGVGLLVALVLAQVSIGVEAWMLKYLVSSTPVGQAVVRTTHVLMGSFILAATVAVMLHVYRVTGKTEPQVATLSHAGGVA
jgi:hypothetical protein